jgi:hypothetical protein
MLEDAISDIQILNTFTHHGDFAARFMPWSNGIAVGHFRR